MNVAIVGSEEKHWKPHEREYVVQQIIKILSAGKWVDSGKGHDWIRDSITLISGGCPKGGVDIWAECVADALRIPKDIKYPDVHVWSVASGERKGYRERNIDIAEACDVLYCFDPWHRDWSGGQWTMRHAKQLGKEIHYVEVAPSLFTNKGEDTTYDV